MTLFAGGFRGEPGVRPEYAGLAPCPFFGPSLSTGFGWLVMTAMACLHLRYPFAAVLGGVPGPVPGYRLLSHAPPRAGWSSRSRWDTRSQVHLLGGNRTRTVIELSGIELPATDTCTLANAVVSQRIAPGPPPNTPSLETSSRLSSPTCLPCLGLLDGQRCHRRRCQGPFISAQTHRIRFGRSCRAED